MVYSAPLRSRSTSNVFVRSTSLSVVEVFRPLIGSSLTAALPGVLRLFSSLDELFYPHVAAEMFHYYTEHMYFGVVV